LTGSYTSVTPSLPRDNLVPKVRNTVISLATTNSGKNILSTAIAVKAVKQLNTDYTNISNTGLNLNSNLTFGVGNTNDNCNIDVVDLDTMKRIILSLPHCLRMDYTWTDKDKKPVIGLDCTNIDLFLTDYIVRSTNSTTDVSPSFVRNCIKFRDEFVIWSHDLALKTPAVVVECQLGECDLCEPHILNMMTLQESILTSIKNKLDSITAPADIANIENLVKMVEAVKDVNFDLA